MSFDVDAADYFSRVAGVGGDFASSLYTATTTQNAINEWFVASRDFGYYGKIAEAYNFVGPTFPGLFEKLKHAGVATLANVNFVAGDLVQAGVGAGLKGSGGQRAKTSYTITGAQIGELSFGAYASEVPIGPTAQALMGCRSGSAVVQLGNAGAGPHMHFGNPGRVNFTAGVAASFMIGTANNSEIRIFRNGVLNATGPAGTYTGSPNEWALFENGIGTAPSNARMRFAFAGTTLTDTDAANLSIVTNALMTRLGANVYGPAAPPAASVRRKHAAAHFFTSRS